ncbi:MAG TPA: aldehyde dehydrogenase family protein [Gaiellaceae bacterium]|nr:aldehyde dehydrogenase family protein [Gaiellaceae bacterium]
MALIDGIRADAEAARRALPQLDDVAVATALLDAAGRLHSERASVLAANAADIEAADLDEATLDRLRLTEAQLDDAAAQLRSLAELPPLERNGDTWTLPNGLVVSEHRIPVGVVGANFEARPLVALDIAGQLLKSLNACVLRTGGAALRSVTALVDRVLHPALTSAGVPTEAVALVRSSSHDGANALVSLPGVVPLAILRGSGESTAALARTAAAHGVQVLAHAEGGGVLYVDAAADPSRADAIVRASLDRLGVCNRLNVLLVHRDARFDLTVLDALGIEAVADAPLRREWLDGHVTVRTVGSLDEAVQLANEQTSGLAAGIVTEDGEVARAFLDTYRGTAAFWNAPTRFTDGAALTGAPETGINVGWAPGPRGPVGYRDLWLRQLRVVGDGTQRR